MELLFCLVVIPFAVFFLMFLYILIVILNLINRIFCFDHEWRETKRGHMKCIKCGQRGTFTENEWGTRKYKYNVFRDLHK